MTATKSPDAFRTISEVATELGVPQHVLRFWETKFSQIKPLKRGGGRRYYRPGDVELIKGIQTLLHEEGYTIRGVQKVIRKQGVRFVSGIGRGLGIGETEAAANSVVKTVSVPTETATEVAAPKDPIPPAPKAENRSTLPPEMEEPRQLSLVPEERLPVSTAEHDKLAGRLETLMDLRTQLTAALEAREERKGNKEDEDKERAATA